MFELFVELETDEDDGAVAAKHPQPPQHQHPHPHPHPQLQPCSVVPFLVALDVTLLVEFDVPFREILNAMLNVALISVAFIVADRREELRSAAAVQLEQFEQLQEIEGNGNLVSSRVQLAKLYLSVTLHAGGILSSKNSSRGEFIPDETCSGNTQWLYGPDLVFSV